MDERKEARKIEKDGQCKGKVQAGLAGPCYAPMCFVHITLNEWGAQASLAALFHAYQTCHLLSHSSTTMSSHAPSQPHTPPPSCACVSPSHIPEGCTILVLPPQPVDLVCVLSAPTAHECEWWGARGEG